MTTDIRQGAQGFDPQGSGGKNLARDFGLPHGKGDGTTLSGRSARKSGQLSHENEQELEKLRQAWSEAKPPVKDAPGAGALCWRNCEEGEQQPGTGAGEWLRRIDEFPLIAQISPATSLTALFEPAAPAPADGPRHPLSDGAEQIVRSLVDRLELNPMEKLATRTSLELVLDRSQFGISGVNVSLSSGNLTVLLVGVTDPYDPGLAAAGQQLVRDLQKNVGVRSVRLHAMTGTMTGDESPDQDEAGEHLPRTAALRDALR